MRENRPSGSEGGEAGMYRPSLPLSKDSSRRFQFENPISLLKCRKIFLLAPLALGFCLLAVQASQPRPANLLVDGDFERNDLRLVRTEQPGAWSVFGLTAPILWENRSYAP